MGARKEKRSVESEGRGRASIDETHDRDDDGNLISVDQKADGPSAEDVTPDLL